MEHTPERPTQNEVVEKDMTYSPSSGTETEELQHDDQSSPALADPDIDASRITTLPGTGGPDDSGDIDSDLNPAEVVQRQSNESPKKE